MVKLLLLFVCLFFISTLGFHVNSVRKTSALQMSGSWQKTARTIALSSILLVSSASPSFAKVGEGGLPDGPLAFQKLIKYQKDWNDLSKSVRERKDSIDEKEILNIKAFLKGLANEYTDMDFLAKSVQDPKTQQEAKDVAKDFRTQIRKCDDALTNNDINAVLSTYDTSAKQLKTFFDLLSDVPDEL